ncbi:phospholipid-transporting ATPase ABCA3-like [Penaeus indicus]|uniref:phospholipid-transporting ATPase ABCA3-like n=1 Tax=Penaeus indicus TaxID=29960 RepID=UPI00300CB3DE
MADSTENASKVRRRKRSLWNKLVLLMWKNLLLRKRHWILTAFEILLPTLLFTLLLTIRVLPDSAFLPSYVNETTEFSVASECHLKETLCMKYGFWSPELGRCFVPDNIDEVTLPTLDPSVIEGLDGLNLTEADLSDPEFILSILESVSQTDPVSIDMGIIQSVLENLDICILERLNATEDVDLSGMGAAEILGMLGSILSNISLPELPEGTNFSFPGERKIFYGPPGNFSEGAAKHLADVLRLGHHVLTPVTSNEDLDAQVDKSYFATNDSFAAFYIGLFFNDLDDPDVPPQHLNYDLRLTGLWFTDLLYPFLQIPGPRNFTIITESYGMDGFTLIQSLVDRYFISQLTGEPQYRMQYRLHTQMYPYPPFTQDYGMSQFYGSALPTFVVLSLVLLSPSLIKSVVYEKETGVRELIRLMGLERWLVWLGWFLHSFIVILVVSTVITILLKLQLTPMDDSSGFLPPIIIHTDPFFMWVLFVLYGISSIAFCFAVSTFFSRPTLATTLGILLWLTSYFLPRQLMDFEYNTLGLAPKILSCFLPNMAITWAFRIIAMFEGRALGVQWNNLWDTGNPRDQLTPAMILIMLAVDTLLYLFITWYVDHVSPGKYGVPLPWYFPFQRSYWCGASPTKDNDRSFDSESPEDEYFEEEPEGLKAGITIKKLRKEFKTLGGKTKVAVEDVSLTCYEGQCTVLLGHNGAGKTTTMSVLTGVYAPSAGYAEVGGWDIATNLKKAREEIGLCPQHNMLFIDLTVLQHLLFFGRLKGMTKKDARKEAEELMQRLELKEKKNMFGNQLSGGMKRKLCLAIALIGGSKVVILDEPSSGLDPESRRWVWEVVQGERGRRTVLVTTHHMEEADVLGDRIAIMASGRVVCSGSTLFLKNKFGDGYTLTIMVSEDSNVKDIKTEVIKHLPEATLRSSQGGEVTFKLPPVTASFAPLLDSLTEQKEKLGIRHLGLSLTSMEQVFLRVGDFVEGVDKEPEQGLNGTLYDRINIDDDANNGLLDNPQDASKYSSQRFLFNSQAEVDMRLTGWTLLKQRIRAFFAKRIIYSKRKWVLLLTQVFRQAEYADNLTDSLLAEADKDLFQYRENNICSADFEAGILGLTTNMKSLYQSVPYHAPGVSTTMVTNALLRFATNSSNHSITTVNRPLPPNRTKTVTQLALTQVQVMTGAPLWALWTTTFLWDLLTYMVSALAVFIFFMVMDSKDYFTVAQAPGALFLLLVLYGWGSIPMAYVFSFPFQTAASGFAVLALINIVAGQIITTAVWALDLSDQPDLIIVSDVLHWITSLIPAYPASMAFMHLVDTSTYNTQCDQFNETVKEELCNTLTQMLPNNSYMICCRKLFVMVSVFIYGKKSL